jgi:BirA family transcriptional regulator, biotin operon repressor / biotin---[acetyl-CoA-carboxylase] ligase
VASLWSDLDRPPLSGSALAAALTRDGFWRDVRVVAESGSTNDDVAAEAAAGAAEGLLIVAESQVAGRGRQGRVWVAPARAGLTFSMLLRPGVPAQRLSWLPLLAGLSVQRAVSRLAEVEAVLKWPNDLLLGPDRRKACGLLMQASGTAVVVGIGLNVTTTEAELPRPDTTSLLLVGAAVTDRDPLLRAIARQFATDYRAWREAAGDPTASGLLPAYLAVCDTIGRRVRATLPTGTAQEGTATGLDDIGRLVIDTPTGPATLSAADVEHVRPVD